MWFDSHCHLQERYLHEVPAHEAPAHEAGAHEGGAHEAADGSGAGEPAGDGAMEAMRRARAAGVTRVICIGTDTATSAQALGLARVARGLPPATVPAIWSTVGLHPHEASSGTAGVAGLLADAVAAADPPPVGVGECGLDYHYEHSPRDVQRRVFAEQIALAHEYRLTLVVHAREAWDDLFEVLEAEGVPERTVLHCFTGGPDEARRCLDAGMFVSFSGIVTFKNAADVRAAAAACPLDRLLVETDSPFLAPVPHRGRPNEPSFVPLVGEAIAALRGVPAPQIARTSAAAAAAAFGLDPEAP